MSLGRPPCPPRCSPCLAPPTLSPPHRRRLSSSGRSNCCSTCSLSDRRCRSLACSFSGSAWLSGSPAPLLSVSCAVGSPKPPRSFLLPPSFHPPSTYKSHRYHVAHTHVCFSDEIVCICTGINTNSCPDYHGSNTHHTWVPKLGGELENDLGYMHVSCSFDNCRIDKYNFMSWLTNFCRLSR